MHAPIAYRYVLLGLALLAFGIGCTGKAGLGMRVAHAPDTRLGEGEDEGATMVTLLMMFGIGTSDGDEHAFIPTVRMNGGGAIADDSGGVIGSEVGAEYTWLPEREALGLRIQALGGANIVLRETPEGWADLPEEVRPKISDELLFVGWSIGGYFALTDRGRSGGGKYGMNWDAARTTTGIAATVGMLHYFGEAAGPAPFAEVSWELVTFD